MQCSVMARWSALSQIFHSAFLPELLDEPMTNLYKDLLEAGGGALPSPHVGAGHLIDQNETRQFRKKHLQKENIEKGLGDYL